MLRSRGHLTAWTRVYGTVYMIRCQRTKAHWWSRRTDKAYIGKYATWKYEERIRQHLYGGGRYGAKPKPFADLVSGYDPFATTLSAQRRVVKQMIAAGTVYPLWQKECYYWYLKVRESFAIGWHRPVFNIAENMGNSRHIPKWRQEAERAQRDAGRREWNANATGIRIHPSGRIEHYGPGWRKVS